MGATDPLLEPGRVDPVPLLTSGTLPSRASTSSLRMNACLVTLLPDVLGLRDEYYGMVAVGSCQRPRTDSTNAQVPERARSQVTGSENHAPGGISGCRLQASPRNEAGEFMALKTPLPADGQCSDQDLCCMISNGCQAAL